MKTKLLITLTAVALFFAPNASFGAAPSLGSTSGFALFTASGTFTNIGASSVTGNVGSFTATPTGFPGGSVVGTIYNVGDPALTPAAADVSAAFDQLSGITDNFVLGTPLETQILLPGVYYTVGAATLNGDLTLDGQGNPDAIFIIKIKGALTMGAAVTSHITLINSASLNNVYWQIGGQFDLGVSSVFRGTIVANGAINLMEGSSLLGRGLTTAGAISLHNNVVTIPSNGISTGIASINTKNSDVEISIAPNPFGSFTTIILKNDSKINTCDLKIYNTLGKEVMNTIVTKQGATIDMNKLQSGIYFYKVMDDYKTIQSGKLISQQ